MSFTQKLEELTETTRKYYTLVSQIDYVENVPNAQVNNILNIELYVDGSTFKLEVSDVELEPAKQLILGVLNRNLKANQKRKQTLLNELNDLNKNEIGKNK